MRSEKPSAGMIRDDGETQWPEVNCIEPSAGMITYANTDDPRVRIGSDGETQWPEVNCIACDEWKWYHEPELFLFEGKCHDCDDSARCTGCQEVLPGDSLHQECALCRSTKRVAS